MRPIHSLFVVVALAALAAVCWLALGGEQVQPEVAGVAPVPVRPSSEPAQPVELTEPGALDTGASATSERVAIQEPVPAAVAATEQDAGPRLLGTVLDGAGQPIAGARVLGATSEGLGFELPLDAGSAMPGQSSHETTTDAAGQFDLTGLRAGAVRLAVRAPGFAPFDANDLALPAGGAHQLDPITMQPSVVLTGRVVTEEGRGVAGAQLVRMAEHRSGIVLGGGLGHSGAVLATTATDGSFTVDELGAGSFTLRVTHGDHPDRVEAGKTFAAGERVDGLTIVMEHGLQIHGRVTGIPEGAESSLYVQASPEFGDESGRVTVTTMSGSGGAFAAESRHAEIQADGSFVLRGVREDQRYAVSARRERSGRGLEFFFSPSLSAKVIALGGDRGLELAYKPEGALLFQVVDAQTRAPITSYQVEGGTGLMVPQRDDSGRLSTDHPEGRGRFGNLRPKSDDTLVSLRIQAVGYEEELLEGLSVRAGQELDLGVIELRPAPLVRVTVTDGATGDPVEGARVSLVRAEEDGGGLLMEHTMDIDIGAGGEEEPEIRLGGGEARTAITDEQGSARLTSFAGERAILSVVHREHAPHTGQPFVASATGHEDLAVSLGRGGAVTVTMLTTKGEPLAGARVEHRAPGQDALYANLVHGVSGGNVTDSQGRVTFAHLAPGAHSFRPAEAASGFSFSSEGGNMSYRVRRSGAPAAPQEPGWEEVLVSEGSSAEVSLVAPVRVGVEGRVFEGGKPLEGATIVLVDVRAAQRDPMMAMLGGQQGGPEARTDGTGHYRLENVRSGEYTVRVTHPERHMPAEFPLMLGDEERFLDLELTVTVVEGKVTDEDGNPLEGVRVWPEVVTDDGDAPQAMMISVMVVDDGGGAGDEVVSMTDGTLGGKQALTDSNGNYSLRGIRDGVDIVIKAEGGAVKPGKSEVLNLAPDEFQQNVNLLLGAAGKLEIVAEQADGRPGSNLLVIAVWDGPEDGEVERKTGFMRDGTTTLDGLTPGPWRVEVREIVGLGGAEEPEGIPDQVVQVKAGETVVAAFEVP